MDTYKVRDYARIASDKLQNREVTCAGCQYRVLSCKKEDGEPPEYYDHCERGVKAKEKLDPSIISSTTQTTKPFKTICPQFKGIPVEEISGTYEHGLLFAHNTEITFSVMFTFFILNSTERNRILKRFINDFLKAQKLHSDSQ